MEAPKYIFARTFYWIPVLAAVAYIYWSGSDNGLRKVDDVASVLTSGPPAPEVRAKAGETSTGGLTAVHRGGQRTDLVPQIKRELVRVGCFAGPADDVWSAEARAGAKAFGEHIAAQIATDNPGRILLTLLQGFRGTACALTCPVGMTAGADGICRTPEPSAAVQSPALPAASATAPKAVASAPTASTDGPAPRKPAATAADPPQAARATTPTAGTARLRSPRRGKPDGGPYGIEMTRYIGRPGLVPRPALAAAR